MNSTKMKDEFDSLLDYLATGVEHEDKKLSEAIESLASRAEIVHRILIKNGQNKCAKELYETFKGMNILLFNK